MQETVIQIPPKSPLFPTSSPVYRKSKIKWQIMQLTKSQRWTSRRVSSHSRSNLCRQCKLSTLKASKTTSEGRLSANLNKIWKSTEVWQPLLRHYQTWTSHLASLWNATVTIYTIQEHHRSPKWQPKWSSHRLRTIWHHLGASWTAKPMDLWSTVRATCTSSTEVGPV